MTKKSFARLARDAKAKEILESQKAQERALKENTCWEDLNGIYSQCVGLLQSHALLATQAQNTEVLAAVADKTTLISNIRMLAEDLKTLSGELAQLHALHTGKAGGSQDPDEVLHSIQIFEQYNLWLTKHDGVVMPTVYHVLEQFNLAEQVIAQRKAATDVSVVTDVTVKEESVVTGTAA